MKVLQKISWNFRKIHITLSPITLYINNVWDGWGLDILSIQMGLKEYSLLKITWYLPNGAEKKFKFSGDFLFLRTPLLKHLDDLQDTILWSTNISKWDEFKFWTLKLIFNQ